MKLFRITSFLVTISTAALIWTQRAYLPYLIPAPTYATAGTAGFTGTTLTTTGIAKSQQFQDNDNTAYLLDPAATGNSLLVAGSVGVGTTDPSTYKMKVSGAMYAGGSSRRYKENITGLLIDTDKLYQLKPVSFDFKPEWKFMGKLIGGGHDFGLIAEDVASVIPELALSDGKQISNVDYEKLSVLLLAEIQKQKVVINNLVTQVQSLSKQIELLQNNSK